MTTTKRTRSRLLLWLVGAVLYADLLMLPMCNAGTDSDTSYADGSANADAAAPVTDAFLTDAPTLDASPADAMIYDAPVADAADVSAGDADAALPFGVELLENGGFEAADVQTGGLPNAAGFWRGDVAARVSSDQGISPRAGAQMLKFQAAGPLGGSAGGLSSQQWQLVDLTAFGARIDAGKVKLDSSVHFNRVAGDGGTDTRFDLRILAFTGAPASFPAAYPPPSGQIRALQLASTAASWQKVDVTFDVLPAGTRFVAVEIYAYEDVVDDVSGEFHGHYADDASLILTELP